MDNPTVSVIIPCYNSERFIRETLESVLCQSYNDFEVILVDDGSQDNTREIVNSFNDKRITYLYKENKGMARARNKGIEISRGEYVAFLDHDDIWYPHKIELQVNEIKRSIDIGAVSSGYIIINEKGEVLGESMPQKKGRILKDLLIEGNIVGSPSCVLVRKEAINKVGGFDSSLSISADWDLWIKIAKYYEITFVNQVLTKYRIHENSFHKNLYIYERDAIATLRNFFKKTESDSFKDIKKIAFGNEYIAAIGSYFKKKKYISCLRVICILFFYFPETLLTFLFKKIK